MCPSEDVFCQERLSVPRCTALLFFAETTSITLRNTSVMRSAIPTSQPIFLHALDAMRVTLSLSDSADLFPRLSVLMFSELFQPEQPTRKDSVDSK